MDKNLRNSGQRSQSRSTNLVDFSKHLPATDMEKRFNNDNDNDLLK